MANATDPSAHHIHGADPQSLLDRIIRLRIYDSPYWKEHCFGLNAATLIDQAVLLSHIGGAFGPHITPTPFLCLTLKLLQIQPPIEAIEEFIAQGEYKYLRLLGAFYYRLVGRGAEVWRTLEGLLADYRKVKRRKDDGGWEIVHVDEVVDEMLQSTKCMSISLPRLMRRERLVISGKLEERKSRLMEMLQQEGEVEGVEEKVEGKGKLLMRGDEEMKDSAAAAVRDLPTEPQQREPPLPPPSFRPTSPAPMKVDTAEHRRHSPSPKTASSGQDERAMDRTDKRDRSRDRDRRHRGEREEERRRRRSVSESRSPERQRSSREYRRRGDERQGRPGRYDKEEESRGSRDSGHRRSPSYSRSRSRSRSRSPRRHHRRRSRS